METKYIYVLSEHYTDTYGQEYKTCIGAYLTKDAVKAEVARQESSHLSRMYRWGWDEVELIDTEEATDGDVNPDL